MTCEPSAVPLIGFVGGLLAGAVIGLLTAAIMTARWGDAVNDSLDDQEDLLISMSRLLRCLTVRDRGRLDVASCPRCEGQVIEAQWPFLYPGHQN